MADKSAVEPDASLLPCPFCGGTKLAVHANVSEDEPPRVYALHVFCISCHCHGRSNFPIGWVETEQAARDAWNNRAPVVLKAHSEPARPMTKAEFAQRCARLSAKASRWAADTLDFLEVETQGHERPSTIFRFTNEMRGHIDYIDERAGRASKVAP